MQPAVLALVLAVAAAREAGTAGGDPAERRRGEIARELVRVGEQLRREIVAGNAQALAARVPPDGLRCAGRIVPRRRVARDLSTPGSWLHDTLFGAGRARAERGAPAASVAELLRSAPEVAIAVSFVKDPRAAPVGRPCLEFRVKGAVTPGAPLCFEQRDGAWWFTESLYPCS